MAPIPGWYQDPADPGQMRYWDGATWTSATGAMPRPRQAEPSFPDPVLSAAGVAPAVASGSAFAPPPVAAAPGPTYAEPPRPPLGAPGAGTMLPSWGAGPKRPRFSRKAKIAVAAGLAAVVAAGVTVPLVLSSQPDLTKSFQRSLLTTNEVSGATGIAFKIDTSTDNSSSDSSSTGCQALDEVTAALQKSKADVQQDFVAVSDANTSVNEDLSNSPNYKQQVPALADALQSCGDFTLNGTPITVTVQSPMIISGSDYTLEYQVTAEDSGQLMVDHIIVALFGNNVLAVDASGVGDVNVVRTNAVDVMAQAVTKAKSVLHRKG